MKPPVRCQFTGASASLLSHVERKYVQGSGGGGVGGGGGGGERVRNRYRGQERVRGFDEGRGGNQDGPPVQVMGIRSSVVTGSPATTVVRSGAPGLGKHAPAP